MPQVWIAVPLNITPEQEEKLRQITFETRVTRNEIIRSAIDEWINKREEMKNVIL